MHKPPRSNRQTEKTAKYGHPETISSDEDPVDAPSTIPVEDFTGIGNFQPRRITQDDTKAQHECKQADTQSLPKYSQQNKVTTHEPQCDMHQEGEINFPEQKEGERELDPHEL